MHGTFTWSEQEKAEPFRPEESGRSGLLQLWRPKQIEKSPTNDVQQNKDLVIPEGIPA